MEGNKHADCKHVKPENVGNKQKEVCESSKEFVRKITQQDSMQRQFKRK